MGTGIGLSDSDEVVIEVYVEEDTPALRRVLPRQLDGIPVRRVVTGKITAYTCAKPTTSQEAGVQGGLQLQ